jgi:DNA invertase Pin-like site-specific DNA recombinase
LTEALAYLRSGDTLVVWKLDRLGRSMSHLIEKVGELAARGIGFRSLTENIDTTTSGGMLVFNIFGSLAQFERDLIRERTHAGLKLLASEAVPAGVGQWSHRQAPQGTRSYRFRPHRSRSRRAPQDRQNRPLQSPRSHGEGRKAQAFPIRSPLACRYVTFV